MGPAAHLEDFEAIDVQDAHHLPLLAWLHLGDGGVLSHVPAPAGQGRGSGGGEAVPSAHLDAGVDAVHQPVEEAAVDVLGQRVPAVVALGRGEQGLQQIPRGAPGA